MARLNSGSARPVTREQFAAIAELRWRIFVNSLQTLRGRLELVSRVLAGIGYFIIGIGGTIGLGVAAWYIVSYQRAEWLAVLLWGILLYWQLFPVMATTFAETFDAQNFLRFPLNYRSYFLMRLAYGSLDPTTLVAILWLGGLAAGIGAQQPSLLLWALLVGAAFAAFNVSLSHAIFSWIERWLARRKSREILILFFLFFVIGVQFISPLTNYYIHHSASLHPALVLAQRLVAVDRFSPPGLASVAVSWALKDNFAPALGAWVLLCFYTSVCLAVLHVRLLAQYRGESLSEAPALMTVRKKNYTSAAEGWDLGRLPGSVAAVFEKEFHYLFRSGPMLFPLVMPVVILAVFRFGAANARHNSAFLTTHAGFAFPIGMAYALLILSGFSYNCFGTEGAGVQFYYLSPVRFRDILLAKNLAQGAILVFEMILVWVGVAVFFHPPSVGITLATLVGALFAALVNFTVGNLMSLYAPKRIDWAALGKQRGGAVTGFAVLGVQAAVLGLAVLAVLLAAYFHETWVATVVLFVLAAAALRGYTYALGRIDTVAVGRRETVLAEICRAP